MNVRNDGSDQIKKSLDDLVVATTMFQWPKKNFHSVIHPKRQKKARHTVNNVVGAEHEPLCQQELKPLAVASLYPCTNTCNPHLDRTPSAEVQRHSSPRSSKHCPLSLACDGEQEVDHEPEQLFSL